MASILDLSDQFLDNLVLKLNHPENAALPNNEFDNVEENMCNGLLDVLDSVPSPGFGVFGDINYDSGSASGNICRNVAGDLMQLESGSSSSDTNCNVCRGIMRAEQAAPVGIFPQIDPSFSDLRYNSFESVTSSSNVDYNGMEWKRKNNAHDSNASVPGACALKVQHCESDVNSSLANHQLEELLSHRRTTTPVDSSEQSQLDECQVQLIGKSSEISLKNAEKSRRKQPKSHTCAECGKQFSTKHILTAHSMIHTDERPYQCSQCDYASRYESYLISHEKIHSDARPFECSTCHATFKRKQNLTDHQRSHSENEFTCDYCNKTFRSKTYLRDHKNIHTGERPYECNVCNKTFALKIALTNHRRRHRIATV